MSFVIGIFVGLWIADCLEGWKYLKRVKERHGIR